MRHLLIVGAGPASPPPLPAGSAGEGYAVGFIARREEALAELGPTLRATAASSRGHAAEPATRRR